jgi:hypothetical protein
MIDIDRNMQHENTRYQKVLCWAEQCVVVGSIENKRMDTIKLIRN